MSADGNIEVQVSAEGVDEAADDLAGGDAGGGGGGITGGGGGGEGGGLSKSLKGGIFLAALKLILNVLGPLKEFIGGIFEVLQAFLAPVALLLMRAFQPVLRELIKLLPTWFRFMDKLLGFQQKLFNILGNVYDFLFTDLSGLPGRIWRAIKNGAGWIANGASSIGSAVWKSIKNGAGWIANGASSIGSAVWKSIKNGASWITDGATEIADKLWEDMQKLPGQIAEAMAKVIPGSDLSIPGTGDDDGGDDDGLIQRGKEFINNPSVNVELEGSVATWAQETNRNNNYDGG